MSQQTHVALPSFAQRTSLREQVTEALRAAVISGKMEPGKIYSAPTLAAEFGVSATPVREAMLDLVKQGMVEVCRNKGFQVKEVSDAELDQLTEIRLLLEPPSAVAAARAATVEDVERLRPLAQATVDAAASGDVLSHIEADRAFHEGMLQLAGNQRLVEIVADLRTRTRLYGLAELARHGKLASTASEHLVMCDYLMAGDTAALEKLTRQHIGHVRHEWAGRDTRD